MAREASASPAFFIRFGTDNQARPGSIRLPQLRLLDVVEEQGDGAVEDHREVPVRDLAPQECLYAPNLVVGLFNHGQLRPVALRRRGPYNRTRRQSDRG